MSDSSDNLSEEEAHYLQERIEMLFEDKKDLDIDQKLMLAYIQGMTESLIAIVRPDLCSYTGHQVLMTLAKRAGGINVKAYDEREGSDFRCN